MLFSVLAHDPARGPGHRPVDLEVDEGVTLAQLRAHVAVLSGDPAWGPAGEPVTCDGRRLDGTHPAGAPPWVHGSVLVAGPSRPSTEQAAARAAWHVAVTAGPATGAVGALDDRLLLVPVAPAPAALRRGARAAWPVLELEDAAAARLVVRRRGRLTRVRRIGRGRSRLVLRWRRLPPLALPVGPWLVPWPASALLRTGASTMAVRPRPAPRDDEAPPSSSPGSSPPSLTPVLASVVGGASLALALRQPWLLAAALAAPLATLLARPRRRRSDSGVPDDVAAIAVGRRSLSPGTALGAGPGDEGSGRDSAAGTWAVVGRRTEALAAARPPVLAALAAGSRLTVLTDRPDDWAWTRWAGPATSVAVPDDDADARRLVVADDPAAAARLAAEPSAATARRTVLLLARTDHEVPAWCPRRVAATDLPQVGRERAERLVRRLAARHDGGPVPSSADAGPPVLLPPDVRLGALPGVPGATAADVAAVWEDEADGTRVALGRGPRGVVHLDLREDGPHLLVAGTTGAGKSELLATLTLALALRRPPERLALLLVDFKGGTGLGPLAGLPHVVDHVSDLDPVHASRLLVGLRAELRRRERVLRAAGVRDLDELPLSGRPPRLVVVVDELRALVDDVPGAAAELARLAAQGRALGVHLVLATQRPAGAVGADLRANLGTRVALRVRDREDSLDVVGSDAAARIGRREPGRAVLRRPGGPVEHVQVALVRRALRQSGARLAPPWPGATWVPATGGPEPGDDLAAWVSAACAAAAGRRPAVPWARELPARVTVEELAPPTTAGPRGVVLALADLPEHQRREVVPWSPDAGHLMVAGGPGSGRTTALLTVASQALATGRHVHAIGLPDDAFAALAAGDRPPPWAGGLGSVLPSTQARAAARLLHRLARPAPGPRPLLVVDGLPALLDALAGVARGAGADLLAAVLRGGRGAVVVAAADSRAAASSVAAGFPQRLLLRSPDPETDALLGVPAALRGARSAPGRAVLLADGRATLCQVPLPATPRPAAGGGHRTGRTAPSSGRPVLVRALPERCTAAGTAARGPADVPVGIGGDDARVLRADLTAGLLVAGPPGSGRTTALRGLSRALHRSGASVVAPGAAGAVEPDPARRPTVVVVDDADELERASPGALERLLADHPGAAPLLATSAAAAASAFHGPVPALVAARRVLVLDALDPASAQLVGAGAAALADAGAAPPGRGVLVQRRLVEPVQVFDAPARPAGR